MYVATAGIWSKDDCLKLYDSKACIPWIGKIPRRRKWQPTPIFLPGKSHGQWSLVGYLPWGRKESDTTERDLQGTYSFFIFLRQSAFSQGSVRIDVSHTHVSCHYTSYSASFTHFSKTIVSVLCICNK